LRKKRKLKRFERLTALKKRFFSEIPLFSELFSENALILPHSASIFLSSTQKYNEHIRNIAMHTIENSYRGLSLLFAVNWDRLLFPFMIAASLFAGAFLGSAFLGSL
jgi:hypothetical protein